MPDQPVFKTEAVDWRDIGDQVMSGFLRAIEQGKVPEDAMKGALAVKGQFLSALYDFALTAAIKVGNTIKDIEDPMLPFIAALVAPSVSELFGAEVDERALLGRLKGGAGNSAAVAIVRGLMDAMEGETGGELTPGRTNAARFAGAAVHSALEGTFNAIAVEMLSHMLPEIGPKFEGIVELPDNVIQVLGVSRLIRRALGPLVDATCATPMRWDVNRRYRPELLSAAVAAKQIARGFGDKEHWMEELRRQGYSEERIGVLLNEQRHFFSAGEVRTFVTRNYWNKDKGLRHLRDQGYDENAALDAMRLEGLRRIEQLEDREAAVILAAYVQGDIDKATFTAALKEVVTVDTERALLEGEADVRRTMNIKRLTPAQVAAMVEDQILSFVDYRRALERDGYEDFAIDALDLQLRKRIDDKKAIEQHRAEQAAAKAAAAKARAEAVAARRAELERQRALERRGNRATLERAAIRGLIPLDRVAEIYAATVDADTAGIYMALLEDDRQQFLAAEQAREDAKKRGAGRGVDVGALDQAVTRGVLSIGEYTDRLRQLGFSADDARLLSATLQAKLDDIKAAKDARDEAIAAGKVKHVSVQTIEMLVRRGHRTMADYDQLLQSLGFDDGARAAMIDLLQDQIDEDAKARAAREAAAGKADARGLTLEQARRAVLLGIKTLDDYQRYLVDQKYTADAQIVLVDELRADVAEAEAARQRRAEAESRRGQLEAPIADVARAARLGLIPVQVYADRLARAGYSADAIDLEIDLLVEEMADVAAARQARDAANASTQAAPLPLAQVERAVKAGLSTLADYMAAARAAGFSDAAVDVLSRLLQQELDAAAAADARRAAIAATAAQRALSLSQLEAAVRAGLLTLDDYAARIRGLGYGEDDAAILVTLLGRQLVVLDQAKTRRAAIATGQPEAHVTLAQLEKAVLAGIMSMREYLDELRRRGYGEGLGVEFDADGRLIFSPEYDGTYDDTALLGLLLQVSLDNQNAKGGGQ